ncbi:galactose mutarotase-like domain-containing protein [Calycina marina]|uniref:Galactose mutarotase-like domain-containing protein n=1 Tax=Calycina marina TaxID=1763456 RepID=A0A9P7YZR8_9HELO|nr:galactose mutarotase-like domain-containing protein [Calycina marina]
MSAEPVKFLPLGAIIQELNVNGVNIVQGFDTQDQYVKYNDPYFGETIGRVANRVGGAKIENLNGKSYQLAANDGANSLHGGPKGWGKQVWEKSGSGDNVTFMITSKDGDEGYPGTVEARVNYITSVEKGKVTLVIKYEAKLVCDEVEETVLNLTNHSYFNLSGGSTIDGTEVTLYSDVYLPVDDRGIPKGLPKKYATGEDGHTINIEAGKKFTLGATEPDVDDCFTVIPPHESAAIPKPTTTSSVDPSGSSLPLHKLIDAYHPSTKIHLAVSSTESAFQFYTGKYIDVPEVTENGKTQPARGARSGFCVEPSRYVNAVNVPGWRDQVVVKKGDVYRSVTVYEAWADAS